MDIKIKRLRRKKAKFKKDEILNIAGKLCCSLAFCTVIFGFLEIGGRRIKT